LTDFLEETLDLVRRYVGSYRLAVGSREGSRDGGDVSIGEAGTEGKTATARRRRTRRYRGSYRWPGQRRNRLGYGRIGLFSQALWKSTENSDQRAAPA
jgi:hypothetical protein